MAKYVCGNVVAQKSPSPRNLGETPLLEKIAGFAAFHCLTLWPIVSSSQGTMYRRAGFCSPIKR